MPASWRPEWSALILLQRKPRVIEYSALALLFAAGFLLRVWGLSHAHFWDENVYLQNAMTICCGKHNWNELHNRSPLLSLLFAGGFLLWHNDYSAALITATLNALGPVFLYFAGRLFAGRRPAAIAACLLAFTPFLVGVFPPESTGFISDDTGHSLLTDCPALTLLALGFYLSVRAWHRDTALRCALTGFVLAAAVLMRFGSLSCVAVIALLLLAAARPARALLVCGAGFVAGIGPYLCWSRLRYGGFLTTFRNGWSNYQGTRESLLYYIRNSPYILGWATLLGLLLWMLYRGRTLSHARQLGFLPLRDRAGWLGSATGRELFLLAWALVLLVFFSALPHQEPRYILPATLPVFLLAGVGFSTQFGLRHTAFRRGSYVLATALLLWEFLPDRERLNGPFIDPEVTDVMKAAVALNSGLPPATVLYANSSFPDFAYYTNFPIRTLPRHGQALYEALGQLAPGSVFIGFTHFDNGDTPEPSVAWLDANPRYRRLGAYGNIVLYRYEAQPRR